MTAVLVIGFVIEQILKIVSFCIGFPDSRSAAPRASNQATCPCRITRVTIPAIFLSSISCCTVPAIRFSLSEERPTDSGLAEGKSWAHAAEVKRNAAVPRHMGYFMVIERGWGAEIG